MSKIIKYARDLRSSSTFAERLLWSRIRRRQLVNYRFRRQVPLGLYIADFICFESRLIVEIDGSQHYEQSQYDSERTKYLNNQGFKVVRYWNNDVMRNIDLILEDLLRHLDEQTRLNQ